MATDRGPRERGPQNCGSWEPGTQKMELKGKENPTEITCWDLSGHQGQAGAHQR